MYTGSPTFVRFRSYTQNASNGSSWLFMVPGLALTGMALAILIWPQLLAYMIASVMLFAGISLSLWGWSMRKSSRRQSKDSIIY